MFFEDKIARSDASKSNTWITRPAAYQNEQFYLTKIHKYNKIHNLQPAR